MGAPTLIQDVLDINVSGGHPSFSSPTTAGNCIVWYWEMRTTSGGNQPTLTDSQGNTYTLFAASPNGSNVGGFYVATGIVGGSLTASFNTLGSDGIILGMEFSGVTGIEASNPQAVNGAGSTSVSVGPITTTQANTLIVLGVGQGGGTLGTLSNASSWASINSGSDSGIAINVFSAVQGSPGTVSNTANSTGTGGSPGVITAGMIGLKGSGLAPGTGMIVNPGMDGNMRPQMKGGMNA